MIPYTPLHHLLMKETGLPLVMTSGNLCEEPIARDNDEAVRRLAGIADYFLVHNRDIYARYDDSVVMVEDEIPQLLRRARGCAPYPVKLKKKFPQILGCGAELKNTFCLSRDEYAFISQHIGDMENLETMDHYENTISTGASIAMTIECYERGVLTKADTDGIEMTWGNHRSIVAMTEKLAKREGFGNIIADGVRKVGERIGNNAPEYAMHIQGQELPLHDPKLGVDWAIGYRMDATSACHTQGPGQGPPGLPIPAFDRRSSEGRGEPYRIGGSFAHVIQSSGLCTFLAGALPNAVAIIDFMKAVSGWNLTVEELITTGERIANMRHVFNLREGLNPLKYQVPGRAFGNPPPVEGSLAGITVDENTLYSDFLAAMDWDAETTVPGRKKLIELGLDDIAAEFYS